MQGFVPTITLYLVYNTEHLGPSVEKKEWYCDRSFGIFYPEELERSPQLYHSLLPYLSRSYLSSGETGERDYRIQEVRVASFYELDKRKSDSLLLGFLKYLLGDVVEDGAYIKLTTSQAIALKEIAGMKVYLNEGSKYPNALFLHVEWTLEVDL